MPDQKTKRVLLCGGHLDGQWVEVPASEHTFRAPKPQPLTFFSEPDTALAVPLPDVAEYRLEPLPIGIGEAGGRLWIGALGWGWDRDEAIVRALFQRDVALELLGGRRADA
ncbi:hypothetical protein [Streptomyces mirabilis]|uniref:hypothetical protein n=1 Tax=Streptomyces mirabilis TaxID=68239 RepID=UPI003695FF1B